MLGLDEAGAQPGGPSVVIRIVVVDDHPIVRQGLVSALGDEADFEVVGAVGSAEEALDVAGRLAPEVLLLDLELPGLDGVDAIPRLAEASPATGVLVFTAYDADERVLGAIRAGARGYLLKGATTADIAAAVRAVAAGGSALEPRVAGKLAAALRAPRGAGQLSAREREVLGLIAEGLPGKQIARQLGISERTVKFHTASLLRKLGADNRAQAVAVAAERGLLARPRPG
ncbi:MAG TPA: response regulator transcription factor [Chloroflexota bacterium]|nr:response regulator transcription factor [Chloroflexota bacterium]